MPASWHNANMLAAPEACTRGRGGEYSLAGAGEPQLTQAELQGGALHSQAHRCTVRPAQYPPRLFKHGQDVLTLGCFQGVVGGGVRPPEGRPYVRRDPSVRGLITAGGPVVAAFARAGWSWGGRWRSPDYQHFSSAGR